MTPQEHEILSLKIKALAQDTVIEFLANYVRLSTALHDPEQRASTLQALEAKLRSGQDQFSSLTFPWMGAAHSDMQAALFQEAFDELSKVVMDKVSSPLSIQEKEKLLMTERS